MISDLSRKITVQTVTIPADWGFGDGQPVVTDLFTTWASIKEISRKDAVRQALDAETVQYTMLIRYASGRMFDMKAKILWDGKTYLPRTSPRVIEIDKKKFLETIIVRQDG